MKVAVVGAGTAGLYCIIELLESLPEFAKVDLIHSRVIDPLGGWRIFPSVFSACFELWCRLCTSL